MDQFDFSEYPETNFNEVNLSWMLETMSTFKEELESGAFKGDQGDPGPAGPVGPQGDPADPTQVAAAVDSYLAENITQETGYVLDRSLTMANAAAPADLVGDLKSAFNYMGESTMSHKCSDSVDYTWNSPLPDFSSFYLPLTCKKGAMLVGLRFKAQFTAACTLTVALKDKTRATTYCETTYTIGASGENEIEVFLPYAMSVQEYALVFTVSTGYIRYPSKGTLAYQSDDYVTNQGTVYVYNNSNIVFRGDIIYAVGSWEDAFEESDFNKEIDSLMFENSIIKKAIPTSVLGYDTYLNWSGTAPQINGFRLPLTIKKDLILVGLRFNVTVTSACTLTIEIRNKIGSSPVVVYASKQVELSASGTSFIDIQIPCALAPGEYAFGFIVSTGYINYPYRGNYDILSNDDLDCTGTTYEYSNNKIVFLGDILYAAGSWETPFKQEFDKEIQDANLSIDNIVFADPIVTDGVFHGSTYWTISDDVISCNKAGGATNNWFTYKIIKEDLVNNIIDIEFDLELQENSSVLPHIFATKTSGTALYAPTGSVLTESGHCSISVNLNYLVVYSDLDMTKQISWGVANYTEACYATITNLTIKTPKYDLDPSKPFYKNVNDMRSDIDSNKYDIDGLKANQYLTAPNGAKYMIAVSNDGSLHAIPTIPNHTLFIGNSLLLGNGMFGMCASDSTKDYYYQVSQHILSLNQNATFERLSGTTFEGSTTVAEATTWMTNSLLPVLGNNVNLVIIQLGDNVNTDEQVENFATTCGMLIEYVKEHAPHARVAWAGLWYGSGAKMNTIVNACAAKGATLVNFSGITGSQYQSYIGAVVHYLSSSTRTYTIDSYTDDAESKELTVTFTVNGTQYESVCPYTSYTVDGSTLSITGEYGIVTQGGVASHPGDLGFEKIAERIIEALGL